MLVIKLKWTPEGLEVVSNGVAKPIKRGRRRFAKRAGVRNPQRLVAAIGVLQAIKDSPARRITSEQAAKLMGYTDKHGGGLGRFSHMLFKAGKRIGINSREAFVVSRDPAKNHTYWIAMSRLEDFIDGLKAITK